MRWKIPYFTPYDVSISIENDFKKKKSTEPNGKTEAISALQDLFKEIDVY